MSGITNIQKAMAAPGPVRPASPAAAQANNQPAPAAKTEEELAAEMMARLWKNRHPPSKPTQAQPQQQAEAHPGAASPAASQWSSPGSGSGLLLPGSGGKVRELLLSPTLPGEYEDRFVEVNDNKSQEDSALPAAKKVAKNAPRIFTFSEKHREKSLLQGAQKRSYASREAPYPAVGGPYDPVDEAGHISEPFDPEEAARRPKLNVSVPLVDWAQSYVRRKGEIVANDLSISEKRMGMIVWR